MLKLHGSSVSNYYNTVKHALLEKGVEFEEVVVAPSQESEFLAYSAVGKIPVLETEQGYLIETDTLLDYIEDVYPQSPLLPAGAFPRAKVRELVKVMESYLLLPLSVHLDEVYFGGVRNEAHYESSKVVLERGVSAFNRLAQFSPYVAGQQFTYADVFLAQNLPVIEEAAQKLYQWSMLERLEGVAAWMELIERREAYQAVYADAEKAFEAFQA